jgi:hypothetical protein
MAKTKLEELGDIYRVENVIKNTYLDSDGKKYGETHPNALSDGDNKGKGTGGNADQLNTNSGGGDWDINGNPTEPGTGRNALIARNEGNYGSTTGPNGFGPNKPYYPNYIVDNE